MKLINLDEVKCFVITDINDEPIFRFRIGEGIPTVEAVPIEWIKKKLLSCQYEYENDYDKGFDIGWNCAIKTLLKDWEKENE